MTNNPVPLFLRGNVNLRTKIGWLQKVSVAFIILVVPLFVYAQEDSAKSKTTVEWYQIGNLPPETRGPSQPKDASVVGQFMGIHNNALIVAGGASLADFPQRRSAADQSGTSYSNTIRVATRDADYDRNGDSDISPDEWSLTWHDSTLTLPSSRAFGASASHEFGLIAIGGTAGEGALSDVMLIRWDQATARTSVLTLPKMPGPSVGGQAVVIGDSLFVMAGSDGTGPTAEIYAFDLLRIQTNDAGTPVANGSVILIRPEQDQRGQSVSPWRRLPPLPWPVNESDIRANGILVAQNDGRGDRLYLIGGRPTPELTEHIKSNSRERNAQYSVRNKCGDLWTLDLNTRDSLPAWTRRGEINVDGQIMCLSAGAGVALGKAHILIFAGDDERREALSYNAITHAWTSYKESAPDPSTATRHDRRTNGLTTAALRWGDDVILVQYGERPGHATTKFWALQVRAPDANFGWQNMTVLVVYLLSMVAVGFYFALRNNDTDDFFRGGQNIPWWAAACSIYATMMSSLTFVALPALVYRTDWLVYFGVLGVLIVTPIAAYVALPFFRQIDATSAYEYLSKRFNMPVRLFASALFTIFQIGRMGIVLALTALALAAVTPLDAWQSVLIMGVLSLIYSTLGGIEAVIWTDTIQTIVLLMGAILCFGFIVAGIDGGFSGFIDSGMADNKFRLVDLDFGKGSIMSLSIWVIVLGSIGQNLSSYTADQAVVQRYMTTKDTRSAAKSIWTNAFITVPGVLLFFFIGTGLYSFYQSHPGRLDPTIQIDQIFPTFIGAELPIGIAGLIVAGIFAAAQSTVSTSMNSMATTLVTDFMRPFNACRSETGYLKAARLVTVLMGIIGTAAGLLFINPEIRSLMEEYFKVIGMFMGALGGLFVLGVTTRRANGSGALVGIIASVCIMVTVWLMQWANGYLFATIGILSCLLIGYFASLLLPSDDHDIQGLTIHSMHRDTSNQ